LFRYFDLKPNYAEWIIWFGPGGERILSRGELCVGTTVGCTARCTRKSFTLSTTTSSSPHALGDDFLRTIFFVAPTCKSNRWIFDQCKTAIVLVNRVLFYLHGHPKGFENLKEYCYAGCWTIFWNRFAVKIVRAQILWIIF
jgi:hypothetical protein